jgi:mevalonate kinase
MTPEQLIAPIISQSSLRSSRWMTYEKLIYFLRFVYVQTMQFPSSQSIVLNTQMRKTTLTVLCHFVESVVEKDLQRKSQLVEKIFTAVAELKESSRKMVEESYWQQETLEDFNNHHCLAQFFLKSYSRSIKEELLLN